MLGLAQIAAATDLDYSIPDGNNIHWQYQMELALEAFRLAKPAEDITDDFV